MEYFFYVDFQIAFSTRRSSRESGRRIFYTSSNRYTEKNCGKYKRIKMNCFSNIFSFKFLHLGTYERKVDRQILVVEKYQDKGCKELIVEHL